MYNIKKFHQFIISLWCKKKKNLKRQNKIEDNWVWLKAAANNVRLASKPDPTPVGSDLGVVAQPDPTTLDT